MHLATFLKLYINLMLIIKCFCLTIEEDAPPITFKDIKMDLISQALKTKTTIYVESAENIRKFIVGHKIDTIRINNQEIPTLYENAVRDIRDVAVYDLSSNQIQGIEEGTFGNLGLVQALNLSSNLIRVIRSEVFTNIDVKFLFLNHNRIFKIEDGAFGGLQHLYHIDLSYNRLRSWNWRWFKGTAVKGINMRYNSLEMLPQDSFKFLDDLNLPNNQRIMHHLLFDHNEIHRIDRLSLPALKQLNFLDLSYNFLETIEEGTFDNVENFNKLDLSFNYLVYLNKNLFRRTNISYLNLKANYLFFFNINAAPVINLELNPLELSSKKEWEEWKRIKGDMLKSMEYV